MKNSDLINSLEKNGINTDIVLKVLKLKALAEEIGWKMTDYDAMDGAFFATFATLNKNEK